MTKTVTVTDSTTELLKIENFGTFAFWLKNTGATALNTFAIQGRNSLDATWLNVLSSTAEFGTSSDFLIMFDDAVDPTILGAGAEFNFAIANNTFLELRAIATVAAGSTTLDLEVTNAGSI